MLSPLFVLPGVERKTSSHRSIYFLLGKTGSLSFGCCLQRQISAPHLPSPPLQLALSVSFSFFCFSAPFHSWNLTWTRLRNSPRKRLSHLPRWSLWIRQTLLQLLPRMHNVSIGCILTAFNTTHLLLRLSRIQWRWPWNTISYSIPYFGKQDVLINLRRKISVEVDPDEW